MRHAAATAMDVALVLFLMVAASQIAGVLVQIIVTSPRRLLRLLGATTAGAVIVLSLVMVVAVFVSGRSAARIALTVLLWTVPIVAMCRALLHARLIRAAVAARPRESVKAVEP